VLFYDVLLISEVLYGRMKCSEVEICDRNLPCHAINWKLREATHTPYSKEVPISRMKIWSCAVVLICLMRNSENV
jgi:hypothetical protein